MDSEVNMGDDALPPTTPATQPAVDREKTAPFLIRTFVKIGGFHRTQVFEGGSVPTADEQQIFTWKDATLHEVLTTLRVAASSPELRHPLARYSFRAIYADSANRGRFSSKDLGIVYSRDILGEPGSLQQPAPRLVTDDGPEGLFEKGRDERTLDELRFVPGDYLCVAVLLPKNITVPTGTTGELAIKGTAAPVGAAPGGWKNAGGSGGRADAGWGGALGAARGTGRGGGGHWRGGSDAPPARSVRGGAGRGGVAPDIGRRDRDHDVYQPRDDDRGDRRIPPPRRALTPPRRGRGRGGRSRSRSRSPPPRRDRRD